MMKQVLFGVCMLLIASAAMSQDFLSATLNDRYYSAFAGLGFASYRGELKHNGSFQNEVSNVSIGGEVRLWSKIAARIELGRYSIRGHDKHAPDSSFAKQRNLSFESTNYEATVQGVFYLRKYKGVYHKRWRLDPYIAVGVGTTFISPQAKIGETYFNLYELKTEDTEYSRWTLILPGAAGLKWKINSNVNFISEIAYRYTFSDYLDDVSGNFPVSYPDITTELLSNRKDEIDRINDDAYEQLSPGNPRGDSSNKDSYLFLNLKLEIYLSKDMFKPKPKPSKR
ncbi:MAG: hypothetical protein CMP48_09355 [Rickettsiales bacterium]|nr:hypothetical protein [Rickettsiales bacterium]